MKTNVTILYSTSVLILLGALLAWLQLYNELPADADINDLHVIQDQLIAEANKQQTTIISNLPQPVTIPITTTMAWWYPGEPACQAIIEAEQMQLDVVKPEYFVIRDGGRFELMSEELYGCNGYSQRNVEVTRSLAAQQFVMVSSAYAPDMDIFLTYDGKTGEYTEQLVNFVIENNFTGVELDFEDFGGWTQDIYERYKDFVTRLGTELHSEGKQLMIDLPAVRSETEQQWYSLRLSELEKLPVDYMVIMAYDYQFDHGVGQPVSPLDWLSEVVLFTRMQVEDDSRLVIGVPSYGYVGDIKTGRIRIVTNEQAKEHPLFNMAIRDERSAELIANNDQEYLIYQDAQSIQAKINTISQNGIGKISIWHLGGNPLHQQ